MAHWQISERLFLRTSGIPFEAIELDAGPTAALAAALDADRRAVDRLEAAASALHAALDAAREVMPSNVRGRAHRRVRARRAVADAGGALDAPGLAAAIATYDAEVAACEAADARLAAAWATSRAAARYRLWRAAHDEAFREAVLLLSVGSHRSVTRWLARAAPDGPPAVETAATRKDERRIYMYLQRFCTKAETTSFVGPIAGGRLDGDAAAAVDHRLGDAFLLDRRTYPAGWLVRAAAARAEALYGDRLPARRAADVHRRGGRLMRYETVDAFGRRLRDVGAVERLGAALDHVDGVRSLAELRAAHPAHAEALDALHRAGAITSRPVVPRQARDGLAYLAGALRDAGLGGEPFVATVEELSAQIAAFAEVDGAARPAALERIAEAVERAFDVEAFRAPGEHYADRYPFFEDATRDVPRLVLGAPIAALLDGLDPVLDLWLGAARTGRAFRAGRFRGWLDAVFPDRRRVELTEVVERWQRGRVTPDEADDDWFAIARLHLPDPLPRALAEALAAARGAGDASIELPAPRRPVPDALTALASADVLLRPPRAGEGWRAVLGEAHRMVCAFGFFLDGLPAEAETKAAIDAVLRTARGERVLLKPYDTLDAKLSYRYLSDELVDFDPDGLGPPERASVGWSDLALVRDEDGWDLVATVGEGAPRSARFLFASPRELGGAFAIDGASANGKGLPPPGAARCPRVVRGDLVVLRASWAFESAALRVMLDSAPHRAAAALARAFAEQGVPRHTFVKCRGEPKPIYFDLLDPIAHQVLATLARATEGRVVFSEMLPGPDELWFRDARGRYVAELRLNLVRSATPLE